MFAKFRFRGKRFLFVLAVLAVLIPRQVLILPLFMWMNKLSLLDTPWAVILPGAASGIGILYFTAIFRRLPDALLDMARCEGAGEYRVFFSALPLVKPAVIAFALIQFVLCWQEHLVPLVMLSTQTHLTVTVGLASLGRGAACAFPTACSWRAAPSLCCPRRYFSRWFTTGIFQSALSRLTEA